MKEIYQTIEGSLCMYNTYSMIMVCSNRFRIQLKGWVKPMNSSGKIIRSIKVKMNLWWDFEIQIIWSWYFNLSFLIDCYVKQYLELYNLDCLNKLEKSIKLQALEFPNSYSNLIFELWIHSYEYGLHSSK